MLSTEMPACRKKYGMRVEMKLPQTPYGMEVIPKIHEGARRGDAVTGNRWETLVMVSLYYAAVKNSGYSSQGSLTQASETLQVLARGPADKIPILRLRTKG